MKRIGWICIVLTLAICLTICLGCTRNTADTTPPSPSPTSDDPMDKMDMLESALAVIRNNYIEDVDMDKLDFVAAKAVINSLDDFTYLSGTQYSQTSDSKIGLDISITVYNEYFINAIDEDMPAAKVFDDGFTLQRGDEIYGLTNSNIVDDDGNPIFYRLRGLSSTYYSLFTDGGEGTVLTLRIMRDGVLMGDYAYTKVKKYASRARFIPDVFEDGSDIGYISLKNFTYTQLPDDTLKSAADDFDQCMAAFVAHGQKALILDLRNNGGGNTEILASIASYFVPVDSSGLTKILELKYAKSNKTADVNVKKNNYIPNLPLVILCNGKTASAAEVLIGASRAYNGANTTVIGQQTYGKGVFQRTDLTVEDITDDTSITGIKDEYYIVMVSGYYYIVDPAKEGGMYNIHGNPLSPDIEVKPNEIIAELAQDAEMVKAKEVLSAKLA